jgi:hypothetical protein
MYIITTRQIASGELLKYLNGLAVRVAYRASVTSGLILV